MSYNIMGYYDQIENLEQYIKDSIEIDGKNLIYHLNKYIPIRSKVLELGMGAGKDLKILKERHYVTGSDLSKSFLDLYRKEDSKAELIQMNATKLNTKTKFDAIYSNKVLHHLYRKELKSSIYQQVRILNDGGLIAHSFWAGNREEDYLDLHFVYYKLSEIRALFDPLFRILYLERYTEKSANDSIYIVAKKR